MSDYTVPARRRSRSLLIVEGNYEKELYRLIFKAFREYPKVCVNLQTDVR